MKRKAAVTDTESAKAQRLESVATRPTLSQVISMYRDWEGARRVDQRPKGPRPPPVQVYGGLGTFETWEQTLEQVSQPQWLQDSYLKDTRFSEIQDLGLYITYGPHEQQRGQEVSLAQLALFGDGWGYLQ